MTIYHKHHIIPKHMGGSDDPSNLIKLTVEEHAEAHRKLYEEHGRWQDHVAWKGLAGLISRPEIMSIIHRDRTPESYATYGMLGKKQSDDQKKATSKRNSYPCVVFGIEYPSQKAASEANPGIRIRTRLDSPKYPDCYRIRPKRQYPTLS